ncbi:MAG: vitamin K epoxide reductase family protein [Acidobacteriota bacterium]
MPLLVGLLAAFGLVIATSFTLATYRPASVWARLVPPAWCGIVPAPPAGARRDPLSADGCASVIQTPGARVFGVPNSLIGMGYYGATLALAVLGLPTALRLWHLAAAWSAVALGVYLGYRLLRVERMSCPLCWTSHAVNTVLAIVLTAASRSPL